MKVEDIRYLHAHHFFDGNLLVALEAHPEMWQQLQMDHPHVANTIQAWKHAEYLMELALNDLHDKAEREADNLDYSEGAPDA